ncbi:hypothetical protein C9374_008054 [Naegleria lovaniensis]|uniref:Aldehyde dehydrogenase domain-containing protein n=1 Tax=Naegleria lovaniensis TaxID=51637 RepID=A0AA88GLZ3_NAELO|nr:uncharacterized protein C9374_008054 [Naegleria lovaniensis]KAG2378906.1 hypothetical protein C9374_008054 [Naegleria lovaniensis]
MTTSKKALEFTTPLISPTKKIHSILPSVITKMKKLSTQILRNTGSIAPSTTNSASRRLFSTSTVANKKNKVDIKYTKLFIGGQFVEGREGKKFSVINPATEEEICQVSEATKADVDEAVKIARSTFENVWRNYSPHQRSRLMNRWADLIERDADYIADLESLDNGKPREMARNADVAMTISTIRYFAGWADKINGDTIPLEGDYFCYTQREPIGVCAQIVPWNFPLLMATWKWTPCLATGNVSILKTAEQTPLSALYVASLAKEAGFPDGVIQVLSGFGETAGAALVYHNDVDKVSFTGSTEVGKKIQKASAESNLKRVTLELGGKSPLIVLGDVKDRESLNKIVDVANFGTFFNQGQVCTCSSRVYVASSIYEDFLKISKEKAEKRIVGDPFDTKTEQGPQVSEEQFNKIMSYIDYGKKHTRLVTGGERLGNRGYFIKPTVFADVEDTHKIAQEEIFGPVMSVIRYNDDEVEEAIKRANSSEYGLAAGVLTNDLNKAIRVASGLKAGTVWVNCWNAFFQNVPFGGYKQSGIGRDLGEAALHEYTENKSVITFVPGLKRPYKF